MTNDDNNDEAAAAGEPDRYVSFRGIDCDGNADRLIALLRQRLDRAETIDPKWRTYFEQRFEQQARMGHDNLHLIGAQINPLYAFFEACADDEARALLWQLEQECC